MDFYDSIQDYMRPSIIFYMDEVYHSLGVSRKYPTIYIVTYIDSKGIKRVMIDEGLTINIMYTIILQHLNIPLWYLSTPTLAIKDFNNTLSTSFRVVMISLKIKARSIPIAYHVVEGDMQYNILLERPWIDEMEGVSFQNMVASSIYEVKIHCIPMDANPFSHCNLIQALDPFSIPSLSPITILVNNNPNKASSSL